MQQLLILFSDSWADEIDLEGFRLMTEDEWEAYKEVARHATYPRVWYVGTNEDIPLDSADDILDSMTEQPVSNTEAQVIANLLGDQYGTFPEEEIFDPEYVLE